MEIEFIKGDATRPQAKGVKFITHIYKWGKGFVIVISKFKKQCRTITFNSFLNEDNN